MREPTFWPSLGQSATASTAPSRRLKPSTRLDAEGRPLAKDGSYPEEAWPHERRRSAEAVAAAEAALGNWEDEAEEEWGVDERFVVEVAA